MYDSDNEVPQAGPMVEDDPDGVDFDSDDNESNMLGKKHQPPWPSCLSEPNFQRKIFEIENSDLNLDLKQNRFCCLAKQMQFTPADSTMVFELEEKRIMEEMRNKSPDGDETALLEGTMCETTVNMDDTALMDQVTFY